MNLDVDVGRAAGTSKVEAEISSDNGTPKEKTDPVQSHPPDAPVE